MLILSPQNLGALKNLRILSIQSNRITKIEGLESLENLEEFYISHNGIQRIEGLENNVELMNSHPNYVPELTRHDS